MFKDDLKKVPKLLFSFLVVAVGIVLVRLSNLGLVSWGVLHDGLSKSTGLPFGFITQSLGLIILVLTLFIKVYPGLGTLLNLIFIGTFIDLFEEYNFLVYSELLSIRFLYYGVGLMLMCFGMALYISCEMGIGPRDGLLIGIVRLTNINVRIVKPIIEIIITTIGYLLGGTVGIGSIIGMFLSGYILDKFFILLKYDPKTRTHSNFRDYIKQTQQ